jgi:hypothetical protein
MRLARDFPISFEDDAACEEAVFDPSHLADGIGMPPGEVFAARIRACVMSFDARHEEPRRRRLAVREAFLCRTARARTQ